MNLFRPENEFIPSW